MDLIYLLLVVIVLCIVIGVVLWMVNRFVPMEATVKQVMNAAVVIILVLVLLFFVLHLVFANIHIPNVLK